LLSILLIAFSLAMDAFAVSVSTGITVPAFGPREAARIGLWCGAFQFLMPLTGWLLGYSVRGYIQSFDHWIAFALLVFIGARMIWESLQDGGQLPAAAVLTARRLFLLALATSIDALAVGVTLAFTGADILLSAGIIGAVAFLLSMLGGLLGRRLGSLFQRRAGMAGGAVLVGIGTRILLEHLAGAA